ncbi:MAG: anti-sigma factor antagonist [Bacteroidetes bacterium SW_4_67_19]|jgi:anti-sigma B factor antagonist|nr:MAG: anti-sigma factor antagonist [Bacteroidetes bacterium QH_8_67_23]PSQ92697.1 MAG: anti-sigma factor antagonist [Bacteroidetes bacterium SW_4_67_19]
MNYSVDERYNAVVITLKGNIMGGPDGQQLHDQLRELVDEGKTHVVVDLSKTKFMNSSGLGMLISGLTTMRNAGGDLRLARVADRIQSLLVITKLITVFKEFDTVDEAVESFDTEPPSEMETEEP